MVTVFVDLLAGADGDDDGLTFDESDRPGVYIHIHVCVCVCVCT